MGSVKALLRVVVITCALVAIAGPLISWVGGAGGNHGRSFAQETTVGTASPNSKSQFISAAQGGTIVLSDGSSVTIPPGVLFNDQNVTLSLVSNIPEQQPHNNAIVSVGPTLRLRLSVPNSTIPSRSWISSAQLRAYASSAPPQFQFVINISGSTVPGLEGSLPMGVLKDASGTPSFFGLDGTIDWAKEKAQITLPSSMLNNIVIISVSMANWAIGVSRQYGARIWNGSWASIPDFPCEEGAKVLVLVHGMLSSVENAFPKVEEIKEAGKYDKVFGFNYDSARDINDSGRDLADLLNKMVATCSTLSQIDIEAHSEGVPVSLSAIASSNADVHKLLKNVVSLGGPIMGTPIANSVATLFTVALNLPTGIASSLNLQVAMTGPLLTELKPDSVEMETIRKNATQKLSDKNVILVAGTKCMFESTTFCNFLATLFESQASFDGIVAETSAFGQRSSTMTGDLTEMKAAARNPYALGHTQLHDDETVICEVGNLVSGSSKSCSSAAPLAPTGLAATVN